MMVLMFNKSFWTVEEAREVVLRTRRDTASNNVKENVVSRVLEVVLVTHGWT